MPPPLPPAGQVSIPRALSKLGICSRAEGVRIVESGRVRINGKLARDPAQRIRPETDHIEIDGALIVRSERVYLALNKPRGRPTIYSCLEGTPLSFVAPVGRLDKASEGLLLLTNDTRWSSRLLDPASHVDKVYHVQVRGVLDDEAIARIAAGIEDGDTGERLAVKRIALLRTGSRSTAWYEIVLDEGKNRHIRRIFAALDVEVLRLVRIAIGPLVLGTLPKGAWRMLSSDEVRALS
jgi:23S rRNA pseudouridine2605 synthase